MSRPWGVMILEQIQTDIYKYLCTNCRRNRFNGTSWCKRTARAPWRCWPPRYHHTVRHGSLHKHLGCNHLLEALLIFKGLQASPRNCFSTGTPGIQGPPGMRNLPKLILSLPLQIPICILILLTLPQVLLEIQDSLVLKVMSHFPFQ